MYLGANVLHEHSADWLTFDYTGAGWVVRFLCHRRNGRTGLALLARRGIHKRIVRRFVYRTDVTIALVGIAFEIAIPAIITHLDKIHSSETPYQGLSIRIRLAPWGGLDFFGGFFDSDD